MRLTGYTGCRYEAYDPIDTKYDFSETNLQKLIDKLAHYEDLEESGRLVVLPSGVTGKQLCKIVNACPSILGLKNNCGSHSCESCWEAALRGEEEC